MSRACVGFVAPTDTVTGDEPVGGRTGPFRAEGTGVEAVMPRFNPLLDNLATYPAVRLEELKAGCGEYIAKSINTETAAQSL